MLFGLRRGEFLLINDFQMLACRFGQNKEMKEM
jgi:hypothetical protein